MQCDDEPTQMELSSLKIMPAGAVDGADADVMLAPKPRRVTRRALLLPSGLILAVTFAVAASAALWRSAQAVGGEHLHRQLLEGAEAVAEKPAGLSLVAAVTGSGECNTFYDSVYWVPFYFALVFYTFIGLAIVCDEYFCESLEKISKALSLSDDVAGATFMAAGSSAPELFTAIITIFIAPGDQGVGTIVGSAVFNICVIVGLTALCAGQVLELWWYPLVRDSTFYAISIAMMVWAMADGEVSMLESSLLCGVYVLYVGVMMINGYIVDWLRYHEGKAEERSTLASLESKGVTPFGNLNPLLNPANRPAHYSKTAKKRHEKQGQTKSLLAKAQRAAARKIKRKMSLTKGAPKSPSRTRSEATTLSDDENTPANDPAAELEEAEEESTCLGKVLDVISWPLAFAMKISIPDCREEYWEAWYFGTFTMSIMWIGLLSFLMVDFAARAGCILQIPEFLMGLTILAAGTSVPDALSSILVARNGQGNMAVCNVLGSNVFNILLGLGCPWLIASIMADGAPYPTGSADMLEPTIILFGYLIAFVLILMIFNWKMTPGFGYLLLFGQVCYTMWNVNRNYKFVPLPFQ